MTNQPLPHSTFYLGLDLGTRRNPSALALLEELTRPTGEFDSVHYVPKTETVLILRDIRALPLRTPFAEIPSLLQRYIARLRTSPTHIHRLHLTPDATGLGAPVVELLQRAALPVDLHPIVITAGQSVGRLPHADSVPREALLQNIRMRLELKEITIPALLPYLVEFHAELSSLGVRRNQPNDMAFAFALALWTARPNPNFGEQSTPLPGTPGGDNSDTRRLARLIEAHDRRRR